MNIQELIEKAITSGCLIEVLEGKGHYKIESPSLLNVTTPNDYNRILREGMYKLYDIGNKNIPNYLVDCIFKMICGDVFEIYCAVEILYTQLMFEKDNDSPFNIDTEGLLPVLRQKIEENKNNLLHYYEWEGQREEKGMYGYFMRMNNAFKIYFGYSII